MTGNGAIRNNMRDLNIDFMDLYKRTDRFIKDAYSSSEGVSEYIRLMEASFNRGNANIRGWKSDYDNLKHIRWIRNQLAHEVSYDSDICSESDYEWLEDFYKRLFSSTDPLGELRTFEKKVSSDPPKSPTANRSQQSPRVVYPLPQTMQQGSNVNQSSGCLSTFMMMLILSVPIIISLIMLL